ncbi:serine/threonine-protein kinase [Streptomyces sp. NPDC058257]|uniref:serine/threonine-protein kinase n=1 Tax=Streptomyces sp. NPDC058257 TaxID=3346409 RepID=UPI0036F14F8D
MATSPDTSSPDTSPARQDRQRYGRWAVGRLLGQGSLGRVFLAHDATGRAAALKVVHPGLARDQEFRTRFARELPAIGAVRGRRTAALVDADPQGAAPWLATEYVPGPTLAERVRTADGPALATTRTGPAELFALVSALAEALDDIHRAGLTHGGLRPSNVLMAAAGPRVVDFGTAVGFVGGEGRAGYTAPELLATQGVVARPPSDVFSLGAVVAFAATGRDPFPTAGADPDLTDLPKELLPLVTACLATHPAARPAPRTVARMAGLPLPGSRRRDLTLAKALFLAQLAAAASSLDGRWT